MGWLRAVLAVAAIVIIAAPRLAADSVTISIPGAEAFIVTSLTASSPGTTRTTITWSTSNFHGSVLHIAVKADTANFTPPLSGRTSIAATNVSWTVASATNGTGTNGSVNSSTYTELYVSSSGKKNGTVALDWTLGAPGNVSIWAGNHLLTLRWQLTLV